MPQLVIELTEAEYSLLTTKAGKHDNAFGGMSWVN